MTEQYYVISQNDDGEASVNVLTKEQLNQRLSENEYRNYDCVSKVPKGYIEEWGKNMVIIKGELVVPKPIKQVTKWEI
jgi:hypothetical protein